MITGSPDNEKYEGTMFAQVVNGRAGIPNGIIPYRDIIYARMINYYLGGNYVVDWEKNDAVRDSAVFADMKVWPEKGSVEIIDDVIVVKMGKEDE